MSDDSTTLVIVPGHGVCKSWMQDILLDEAWLAEHGGEALERIAHIREGVRIAIKIEEVTLMFSGGETQVGTRLSEGTSYWLVAQREKWFGSPAVEARAFTEVFARDSFENLLFSILGYSRLKNSWPDKIKIVGWGFKQLRFHLHALTLGVGSRVEYVSVNNPVNPIDLEKAQTGEERKLQMYREHRWGEMGELLDDRKRRDPHFRNGLLNYREELAKGCKEFGWDPPKNFGEPRYMPGR